MNKFVKLTVAGLLAASTSTAVHGQVVTVEALEAQIAIACEADAASCAAEIERATAAIKAAGFDENTIISAIIELTAIAVKNIEASGASSAVIAEAIVAVASNAVESLANSGAEAAKIVTAVAAVTTNAVGSLSTSDASAAAVSASLSTMVEIAASAIESKSGLFNGAAARQAANIAVANVVGATIVAIKNAKLDISASPSIAASVRTIASASTDSAQTARITGLVTKLSSGVSVEEVAAEALQISEDASPS